MTNNYKLSYECLNCLITEVYKCLNGLSPDIVNDVLAVSKHRYNTLKYKLFVTDRPKTDRYGRNSVPFRANQICNLLPRETKNSANFDSFKLRIKQRRCLEFPVSYVKHIYQI